MPGIQQKGYGASIRKSQALVALFLATLFLALPFLAISPVRAEKITVAISTDISSGPVILAHGLSFLSDEGLDTDFETARAGRSAADMVAAGDADFAVVPLSASFFKLAGRGDIRIIAAGQREEPGYPWGTWISSVKAANGGVNSSERIWGRKFGVMAKGSPAHYIAGAFAATSGRDIRTALNIREVDSVEDLRMAISRGRIDIAILDAITAAQMERNGEGRILGPVSDDVTYQSHALITPAKLIANSRSTVTRFISAYQRATEVWFRAFNLKKDDDLKDHLVRILQQGMRGRLDDISEHAPFIDPQARLLVGDIYAQIRWHQTRRLLGKQVSAKAIIDLSFVEGHMDVPGE